MREATFKKSWVGTKGWDMVRTGSWMSVSGKGVNKRRSEPEHELLPGMYWMVIPQNGKTPQACFFRPVHSRRQPK